MEFTIIVDTAEGHPFTFQNIKSDADKKYVKTVPTIEHRCLGRYPNSLGDYSVAGGVGRCHVERKSMDDCQSTILGFNDGHRERFESELRNLSMVDCAVVIVECSIGDLLKNSPEYGKKTAQQNAKTLFRSILAYQQDYKVPWMFCDGRGLAEQSAYWFLHRWWEKNLKKSARESAREGARVGRVLSGVELLEMV